MSIAYAPVCEEGMGRVMGVEDGPSTIEAMSLFEVT